MKWKIVASVTGLAVGFVSFLMTTIFMIGVARQQPADVVINLEACQYLRSETSVIERQDSCQLRVDDYVKGEKFVKLRWLNEDSFFSEGRSVTVANDSFVIAINQPQKKLSPWMYIALSLTMLIIILFLALLGRYMKKDA